MSRPFRVGDIVDAKSPTTQAISQPVDKIGVVYVMVNGVWFMPNQLTLVQPSPRKSCHLKLVEK